MVSPASHTMLSAHALLVSGLLLQSTPLDSQVLLLPVLPLAERQTAPFRPRGLGTFFAFVAAVADAPVAAFVSNAFANPGYPTLVQNSNSASSQ